MILGENNSGKSGLLKYLMGISNFDNTLSFFSDDTFDRPNKIDK